MRTAVGVQPLAWDSEFMGFEVGRLQGVSLSTAELHQQLAAARAAGFRLLYWSVAPTDANSQASAQTAGGFLADHKIRVVQPVAAGPTTLPATIRPVTKLTTELEALAVQASEHSRFRLDPGFDPEVAPRLYKLWLRRAYAGELGREVLGYQPQPDAPYSGLLIMGGTATRAEIIMIAVNLAERGKGIGRTFIESARQRARAWGLTDLQLVTQAFNPACRLYEREGFVLEQEEYLYHLWL